MATAAKIAYARVSSQDQNPLYVATKDRVALTLKENISLIPQATNPPSRDCSCQ